MIFTLLPPSCCRASPSSFPPPSAPCPLPAPRSTAACPARCLRPWRYWIGFSLYLHSYRVSRSFHRDYSSTHCELCQ
nr:MAG TPA: hypothetical protein [Bacteriophage sp.]